MKYFPGRIELDKFLSEIEGKAKSEEVRKMLECMYLGYGSSKLCEQKSLLIPAKK